MRNERFWFGSSLACAMTTPFLLALYPAAGLGSGSVEGTVSIQGQPMVGGVVVFVPDDDFSGLAFVGDVDDGGHFLVRSEWPRSHAEEAHFRIGLIPESCADREGAADSHATAIPPQFTDYRTSGLDVWLDARPAWIDIILR